MELKNQYITLRHPFNQKVKIGYWEEPYDYWTLHASNLMRKGLDKGYFVGGQKEGRWTLYSEEGNIFRESIFKKGELIGDFKTWHPDTNVIAITGKYNDNGEKEGLWTWYHESGIVRVSVLYKNGARTGLQQEFNDVGKFHNEQIFII